MASDIECMHKDIEDIKRSITFIQNILEEDYELSEESKQQLKLARKTPISEYLDHKEVKRQLLR
ncbi:MAG: hypothetical protein KKC75_08895 [Nanoarchaeota archaeon]|nr:hypothetical protein [Nanoarchaeota archaeon]MBU1005691.1 hypothetical protein [Nanoarchaeota archaeon]MBU1946418.1 hypothetical protein [Nanoarchaeota archaeon]